MSIVQFNPWREFDRLAGNGNNWVPAADIWESPAAFHIDFDLPGVVADDVEVSVDEGVLKVSGGRQRADLDENDKRHRLERRYGNFSRTFRLPENADEAAISARVENGVLALSIAKKAELAPRRIEVIAA